MVDLYGKDKGNISLPPRLRSPDLEGSQAEDVRNQPTIINMQKAFYDVKVADIEARINRLEERNAELLEEIEQVTDLWETTDAETADEIAIISQQVHSEMDKIETCKNRINEVEKARADSKRSHASNVESINERYKKTKIELVSEIKVLTAKMNVLEDFKKTQNELLEKFQSNKDSMAKNEMEVQETLAKIERKFKFDKEMLKKEMYDRLLDLAAVFQVEISGHINLPIQKLLRENVILKNELSTLTQEKLKKEKSNIDFEYASDEYKKKIIGGIAGTKRNIIAIQLQKLLAEFLKHNYAKMMNRLLTVQMPDISEEKHLVEFEKAERRENEMNFRLSTLSVLLHKERSKIGAAMYLRRKVDCKIKKVVETLYDLKYAVICALENPDVSTDIAEMTYPRLLLYFKEIFDKARWKSQNTAIKSVESIPRSTQNCDPKTLAMIPRDFDFSLFAEAEEKLPTLQEILDAIKADAEWDMKKEMFDEDSLSGGEELSGSYDTSYEDA